MHGHDLAASAAANYQAFAREARGRSPAYESLAGSVADDTAVLRFLDSLPPEKRQPNLLFAAARYLLGDPVDMIRLRALVRQDRAELSAVMMARRTQTNEPARCATLLPALAQLPPPLALIEVGASAGLTCCSTATPTTTPGTRSPARTRKRPPCAARPAGRCRSRRGFP